MWESSVKEETVCERQVTRLDTDSDVIRTICGHVWSSSVCADGTLFVSPVSKKGRSVIGRRPGWTVTPSDVWAGVREVDTDMADIGGPVATMSVV